MTMDRRKLPQHSPSPEAPSEETIRLQSAVRSSRATSEARSERDSPDLPHMQSSSSSGLTPGQIAAYRSSRAGSEVPQRGPTNDLSPTTRMSQQQSQRSSRAGSEVPDRSNDMMEAVSARSSRAGSEVVSSPVGYATPKRVVKTKPQTTPTSGLTPTGGSRTGVRYGKPSKTHRQGMPVSEYIRDIERQIYRTVKGSTGAFEYYQLLHYPLEQTTDHQRIEGGTVQSSSLPAAPSKEPSPQPRGLASPENVANREGGSSGSPSPTFDEAAFNANFDSMGLLDESVDSFQASFSVGQPAVDEAMMQTVSVLSMTTLPDPVSGVPVLGVCLGDYTGHIEYFEVSTSESNNKRIRKSKSVVQNRSVPGHDHDTNTSCGRSVESDSTQLLINELRGREVARRHSHKAYVKTINALTSVAVEPSIKCLTFTKTHSSPSMISYLTANDRVIKLFHVRRDGFNPLNAFPGMEDVLGRHMVNSRYFARLPLQANILPIKEFGPTANSIQALSLSVDGETFMSVEDLQVYWWNLEASDTTKGTCIADLLPPSGAVDEVEELVTAAAFHPTHGSLFMLSRSSGVLNIGDLRDPPSRQNRQFAISTRVTPQMNPYMCPSYDEILCSISAASFLGPDHVVTRDYLSLKLWDLRKPDTPYAMTPVMDYVAPYLDHLYEHDSIFDRFPVAVDDISNTVVTGLYDGAVAVWQPLSSSVSAEDSLAHYRVDPYVNPSDGNAAARLSVQNLQDRLVSAWKENDDVTADVPEPFGNKVLNLSIAPGGERFGYVYKSGRMVYIFERTGGAHKH